MNTSLWIGQVLLAIIFLNSGINKSFLPEQKLVAKGQTGVAGLPATVIHFIGVAELLGTVGIILPWWIQVAPILTPIAALCFAVIMALAAPIHYKRREPQNVAINSVILLISLFVAYGRFASL